jgi:DNA polymerase III alpha subunit
MILGALLGSALVGGGATSVSPINLPNIEEAKGRDRLTWEKELLGVYANSHPLQQMSIDWRRVASCSCAELDERYDGKGITLAGMIVGALLAAALLLAAVHAHAQISDGDDFGSHQIRNHQGHYEQIDEDIEMRRLDAETHQIRHQMDELYRKYSVAGFHTYGEQYNAMHLNQTLTGIAFGQRTTEA